MVLFLCQKQQNAAVPGIWLRRFQVPGKAGGPLFRLPAFLFPEKKHNNQEVQSWIGLKKQGSFPGGRCGVSLSVRFFARSVSALIFPEKPSLEAGLDEEIAYTKELLSVLEEGIAACGDKKIQDLAERIRGLLDTDKIREIRSKDDEDARFGHKTPSSTFYGYKNHLAMIEEKNGELKEAHGLGRADSVGLFAMELQMNFTAFVANIKRITKLIALAGW